MQGEVNGGGRYRMTGPHLSGANRGVQSSERCSTYSTVVHDSTGLSFVCDGQILTISS